MQGKQRVVALGVSGLWRWASHGGVAQEAYRALTAALTDWLLEDEAAAPAALTSLRDSLAEGAGEFLPRPASLGDQPGLTTASLTDPEPVRFSPWLYVAALVALVTEWVLRRRKGLR